MTTYTSPFTGDMVQPTDVSYAIIDPMTTNQQLSWPQNTVPGGTTVAAARNMSISPTIAGLTLKLPPANQAPLGTDILIRNIGSTNLIVDTYNAGASVTLAVNEARYFYITNNSTEDGQWANVVFGAGVAIADAASLAGPGLISTAGELATSSLVRTFSTDYSVVNNDRAQVLVWQGGLGTVNLPAPGTLGTGWSFMLRNEGTGALTVQAPTLKTIDGFSTQVFFPTDSALITFDVNTGNFYTIGLTRQTLVPYSSAIYDVDSIPTDDLLLVNFAPTIQTYQANTGTRTTTLTVTLPAITQIYVVSNQTNTTDYAIQFQVTGTSDVPVIVPKDATAILLTYGLRTLLLYQNVAILNIDGGTF